MIQCDVFVTGGTGFVGRGVLEHLQAVGVAGRVVALARSRTAGETMAGLSVLPVMGDVLEPSSLAAGMEGCDLVFHVAGVNALCLRDTSDMFRVNVEGSVNVVNAAARAGVRRVVYTSSAATLGEPAGTIGREDSVHRGSYLSSYEQSKKEAEDAVFEAGRMAGVEIVSVNPSSVQGPGRSTGTAELLIRYLDGRVLPAVRTQLSVVDIDDCSAGHILAATEGAAGERYVLSGETLTVEEAVSLLRRIAGRGAKVVFLPGWAASVAAALVERTAQVLRRSPPICKEMIRVMRHGHAYDGSRAAAELGLDYTPIGNTFSRTVAWYVEFGFVRRSLPNFPAS